MKFQGVKRIVLTHCGAPNGEAIARDIKHFHPKVHLTGVDSNRKCPNRWLFDKFEEVPPDLDAKHITRMHPIAKTCNWIFPLNGMSAAVLKKSKPLGPKVLSSSRNTILEVMDKSKLYEKYKIPHRVVSGRSMIQGLFEMNVANRDLVVKPLVGKGSRGVFIITGIDDFVARNELKPGFLYVSHSNFISMFTKSPWQKCDEARWVIMPRYRGNEYFVNALCKGGEVLWEQVLHVMDKRDNVASYFKVVTNPSISSQVKRICRDYHFDYWINFQFIDDHLIEINPRISSWVAHSEYSVPYLAVILAEGGEVSNSLYPSVQTGVVGQRIFSMAYLGR